MDAAHGVTAAQVAGGSYPTASSAAAGLRFLRDERVVDSEPVRDWIVWWLR